MQRLAESGFNPRIVFAGTPEFAVAPLSRLIGESLAPVAVLTQPDRPAGRGRRLQPSPVKQEAARHGIPVMQPAHLGTPEIREALRGLCPDLMVVAAYGLILPQDVLEIPRNGCWNIHASLLPRWRGAAPVQRAIEAGDGETGVCVMQMDAGLDTGPLLHCLRTPIRPDDTGGSLHDRLSDLGARALLECLQMAADGSLPAPVPQAENGACYAPRITKAEAELDWNRSAGELERKVRAFVPWPVAWFTAGETRLRVWAAEALNTPHGASPGHILASGPSGIDVATGDGVLRLTEVQAEGGRRMPAADYVNAHSLP